MRSPGVIYRQYRQLRRKLLHNRTVDALLKEHRNCAFGKVLKATRDNGETRLIKICIFRNLKNQDNELELCTCPHECNAFAYNIAKSDIKEAVKNEFDKLLEDPKRLRAVYPELAVYQWVLDKPLTDAKAYPKLWTKPLILLIELLEWVIRITDTRQKSLPQSN